MKYSTWSYGDSLFAVIKGYLPRKQMTNFMSEAGDYLKSRNAVFPTLYFGLCSCLCQRKHGSPGAFCSNVHEEPQGFWGKLWKTKTSGSPGFLCVRLQVCVNAPLPEHFHGCCIKRKLYLHVFDSYLLKKCDPFAPVKSFGSCVEALLPVMHGQYRAPLLRMNWSSFLLQQVSSSCDTLHSSTIMGQLKTDSKKKDGKGSAPYRSLTVVLQQFWHPRTRVFYNHFGFPSWG